MRSLHKSTVAAAFGLLAVVACNTEEPDGTTPGEPGSTIEGAEPGAGGPQGQSAPAPGATPGTPEAGCAASETKCADGMACATSADCKSGVCESARCIAPTPRDGVKNGDESDIDCGGATGPKCGAGKACQEHGDCTTDGCGYDKKCAAARSCTGHFGGDTCGPGEIGSPSAKHVSCCETAPLFGSLKNVDLDKFLVTAGRMRTFIERVKGDVRSFVHTLPATQWNPGWNDKLVPANAAEADIQLGPWFNKKSCHAGDHTGRTYWTPQKPEDFSDFSKDELDAKALNCVSWHLIAAFCAWDGGRMAKSSEIRNAFTQGGQYAQPWLWKAGAQKYVQANEYTGPAPWTDTFNHAFTYGYPAPTKRAAGADVAYYISAPGRFPTSWNEHGHEVAGNLLTWSATGPFIFTRNYSWENHGGDDLSDSDWKAFQENQDRATNAPNGYYAIGGRCAHD